MGDSYYSRNKEKVLSQQKEYLSKNKEKRYAYLKRRRTAIRLKNLKVKTEPSKTSKTWDKLMFGGLREIAIQRDNEQCVECKLTRKEHWELYGSDITVNHINGKGRSHKKPDNRLENLETLCLSCHGRKDSQRARHVIKKKGAK